MQEIIKQVGPSRQLFETVNFAFMKIFDFLVKKALFWTFLLFFGDLRHKSRPKTALGDKELCKRKRRVNFRPSVIGLKFCPIGALRRRLPLKNKNKKMRLSTASHSSQSYGL